MPILQTEAKSGQTVSGVVYTDGKMLPPPGPTQELQEQRIGARGARGDDRLRIMLRMHYHASVTQKEDGRKGSYDSAYEVDSTRERLVDKMAIPYLRGERFFVGGTVCDPKRVTTLRFVQTHQSFPELVPFIRAERSRSSVVTFQPDEAYVFDKGEDITRSIMDEAEASIIPKPAHRDSQNSGGRKVFLVHGHDTVALDQTEVLLLRWGLEPVILRDRANEGRTVIEKIEANSDVAYGLVLLTPDDVGGIAQQDPSTVKLQSRARQNVILEWGYLMAKLGRKYVACLVKKGVELPSDLHGIVRINLKDDVRDSALEIARELRAAGFSLNEK